MHQPAKESSTILKDDDEKNVDFFPMDWQPGNWDVICQRGRENFDHVGNRRFRVCIENNLGRYLKAKTKQEKTDIVSSIYASLSSSSPHGGFVKKDLLSGRWYPTGEKVSREKIGQAIRDAIKQRRAKKDATLFHDSDHSDTPSISSSKALSKKAIHEDRNNRRNTSPTMSDGKPSMEMLNMVMSNDERTMASGPGSFLNATPPTTASIPPAVSTHSSSDVPSFLMFPPSSLSLTQQTGAISNNTTMRSLFGGQIESHFTQGSPPNISLACENTEGSNRLVATSIATSSNWPRVDATFPPAPAQRDATALLHHRSSIEGQNPTFPLPRGLSLHAWDDEESWPEPRPFLE